MHVLQLADGNTLAVSHGYQANTQKVAAACRLAVTGVYSGVHAGQGETSLKLSNEYVTSQQVIAQVAHLAGAAVQIGWVTKPNPFRPNEAQPQLQGLHQR